MSINYHILKSILKLKGEKKSWSQDPVDYVRKRKDNLLSPTQRILKGNSSEEFTILDSKVSIIKPKTQKSSYHLLFYCHGGAFIYGPTKHQWNGISKIVKSTGVTAWLIDYPKAPENDILKITENICQVYHKALESYDVSKIIFIGDSVGGNLLTTLTQGLVKDQTEVPKHLILITPLMDASLTNPRIKSIDPIDPILSYTGVYSAKKMCTGNSSLKDPIISPIYGSFRNFPKIHLFMATNDILMPDQEIFIQKVIKAEGDIDVIKGEGMPHIWPFLPFIPEAKKAMYRIINIIDNIIKDKK